MTVASTKNKISYIADGSKTAYDFDFKIFEDTDLVVTLKDLDGFESTVTNYTVTGAGEDDGGYITFSTAPTANYGIVIQRILPVTQEHDYEEGGKFLSQAHEDAIDRLTMIDQQQDGSISRAVKIPVSDGDIDMTLPSKESRQGRYLYGADSGKITAVIETTTSGVVMTSFGEGLVTQADKEDGRNYIGLDKVSTVDTSTSVVESNGIKTYVDDIYNQEHEWTKQQYSAIDSLTIPAGTGTLFWDVSVSPIALITLTRDLTIGTPTNLKNGSIYLLQVKQDATGGWAITWSTDIKWNYNETPTVVSTAEGVTMFTFITDGTYLYGSLYWASEEV